MQKISARSEISCPEDKVKGGKGDQNSLFRLQIPMNNLVSMTILNGTDDLLEKPPGLTLLHPSLVHYILEQLLPRIFYHHDDIRGRGDDFVELDDVRMSQDFEVLDLTFYAGGHVHVLDLPAVDDLHGDLVAGHRVCSHCVVKSAINVTSMIMAGQVHEFSDSPRQKAKERS